MPKSEQEKHYERLNREAEASDRRQDARERDEARKESKADQDRRYNEWAELKGYSD